MDSRPPTFDPELAHILGWPLLAVWGDEHPEKSKEPRWRDWGTKTLEGRVSQYPHLAVKLGGTARFIDIEGDGPEAEAAWKQLLAGRPEPPCIKWTSERGTHRLFVLPAGVEISRPVVKFGDLEVRIGSPDRYTHYSILPPTAGRVFTGLPDYQPPELPDYLVQPIALEADRVSTKHDAVLDSQHPDAPGTVYNEKETWDSLLPSLGWTKVHTRGAATDWRRPGKTDGSLSATTGYCGDLLYVFSSNAEPLEQNQAYDKFGVFARYKHGGDTKAAAADLATQGFTRDFEFEPYTDGVAGLGESINPPPRRSVDLEAFEFPRLIEDIARYHVQRSSELDYQGGKLAGILTVAYCLSRRVMTETRLRPNLSGVLLGLSTSGKTQATHTVENILTKLGHAQNITNRIKSGEGLYDSLMLTPCMIYIQEEFQDELTRGANPNDAHRAGVLSEIKDQLTRSNGIAYPRKGAGEKEIKPSIPNPHLNCFFTAITGSFWSNLTAQSYRDGFLGRQLIVEQKKVKRNKAYHEDESLLESILDRLRAWLKVPVHEAPARTENGEEIADIVEVLKDPRVLAWEDPELDDAFADEMHELRNAQPETELGNAVASIYGRGAELARKLALIFAACRGPNAEIVTRDELQLAIDVARQAVEGSVANALHNGGSLEDKAASLLARYLKDRGGRVSWNAARVNLYREIPQDLRDTGLFNRVVYRMKLEGLIDTDATEHVDRTRIGKGGTYLQLVKSS